jgi:hypothetical protein
MDLLWNDLFFLNILGESYSLSFFFLVFWVCSLGGDSFNCFLLVLNFKLLVDFNFISFGLASIVLLDFLLLFS